MLALLSILACHGPEKGIDRTTITGTVTIPPVVMFEDSDNDDKNELDPLDLGTVTYRHIVATGTSSSFGVDEKKGFPTGDGDGYLFTLDSDAEFDISLAYSFAPTDDTKVEPTVYEVDLYVLAAGKLVGVAQTTTDGQQGLLLWPQSLAAGTYVAIVYGLANDGGDDAYTLTIGGMDPNTGTFLVGAYESADFATLGPPVGGTTVAEFTLEGDTWSGAFEILGGLRTVVTCEVGTEGCADDKATTKDSGDTGPKDSGDTGPKDTGDTGPKDTGPKDSGDTGPKDSGGADSGGTDTAAGEDTAAAPATNTTVVEGVDQVYLVAGTFASLNSVSLAPGVFYTSEVVGLQTTSSQSGVAISLDTLQPKLPGWTVSEKEPNDAFDLKNKVVDAKLAQTLPVASGGGVVDTIIAAQSYLKKHGGNDIDVFALTAKEDTECVFTMAYEGGKEVNLDMYLADSTGLIMAAYLKGPGDVNPEIMSTADLGSPLIAGEPYYLVVFSYKGPKGDHPYTIEIAYL